MIAPEQNQKTKDELIFSYLQLQRALILIAISFYKNDKFKFDSHILDIQDPRQISDYLNYLNRLQKKPLIQLARLMHRLFDYSKRLKAPLITLSLYLRFIARIFNSERKRLKYQAWVKVQDTPTDQELTEWAKEFNLQKGPNILCLPNSLKSPRDIVTSVQNLSQFDVSWFFYGPTSDLNDLLSVLKSAGVPVQLEKYNFISQRSFNDDLHSLVNANLDKSNEWMIIQNEAGVISKRCLKEVNDWTTRAGQNFMLAYADSDSIDETRHNPKFHPDWNLRYFVGQNCFAGITIAKRANLSMALSQELTTSWPQMLMSLIEQSNNSADQITHIPKILFHKREPATNSEVLEQQEILKEIFLWLKKHHQATISQNEKKQSSIVWPLPAKLPKMSILIPTRDQVELLKKLVTGLLTKTDYPDIEIVIVDNDSIQKSTKAYFSEIQKDPRIKVVSYPHAFNFAAINNFGFKSCTGEILALLNNDIEIMRSDWLKEAVREALAPQVGAVGAKLYYKNGFIQHAGVVLGPHGAGHIHSFERRNSSGYLNRLQFSHELSAVTAACMIMRSEVFSKVSGFNEKDLAVAYNDIDLCIRIRELGLKIIWTPKVELYHLESASRPPDTRLEQIARYRREVEYMFTHWGPRMQHDPFYNPNFAADKFDFEVGN